ncbi:elongin-B-like isoform X1 [Temnothorax curvispinosus]|uniref:Elongin-B-like isoform X1 n=2 Tax=Temnothorax curvispinosus TaxID=300111 RepID=A0A6J1QJJ7_9HYME|nr:elongin-B-like isoform X1 [Temnothorax curvispinosus]
MVSFSNPVLMPNKYISFTNHVISKGILVTGIVENMGKDIYLIIRRQKVTLYLDTQENVRVLELKKMIEAILKVQPEDQQLFVLANDLLDECKELSDSTALFDCGLTSATANIMQPAVLGLAVRKEDGSFESLEITSYSESEWPNVSEIFSQEEKNDAICEKYQKKYDDVNDAKNDILSKATHK